MTTSTPKLNLTSWVDADPFTRTDFNNNNNVLDASPGITTATSSSRPTLTSAQSGRSIYETDTRRLLMWSGSAYVEPAAAPGAWVYSTAPVQNLTGGASASWTLASITVQRACQLLVISSFRAHTNQGSQWILFTATVDGKSLPTSNLAGYIQWPTFTSSPTAPLHCTVHGIVNVTPGTHTIGAGATVSNSSNVTSPITVDNITQTVLVTSPNGGATTL